MRSACQGSVLEVLDGSEKSSFSAAATFHHLHFVQADLCCVVYKPVYQTEELRIAREGQLISELPLC